MKGEVIVILGCLTNDDGSPTPMMKSRLHKGAEVYRELMAKNVAAPHVILTGYQANGQVITEAKAMKKYSLSHQLFEEKKIIIEEDATKTEENAYFSRIIIDELGLTDVCVVTSEFHFKRANDIFSKVFPSICYKVEFHLTTHDMDDAECKRRTDRETKFFDNVDKNLEKIARQRTSADLKPVTILQSFLIPSSLFQHGFSTRFGGVSTFKTLSSLNLYYTPKRRDPKINVNENRRRLAQACNFSLDSFYLAKCNHGSTVWVVGDPEPENYDGIVTNRSGVTIAAPGADCMIILFCDPVKKVCGAAHAGWAGTLAQICSNVIIVMMNEFGCNVGDICVVIGPSIGPCHFEVGEDLANRFKEKISPDVVVWRKGAPKPFVNLRKSARLQLETVGVRPENIEDGSR